MSKNTPITRKIFHARNAEFRRKEENLNLCHISEDGRLKTLSFSATDERRVYEILEAWRKS